MFVEREVLPRQPGEAVGGGECVDMCCARGGREGRCQRRGGHRCQCKRRCSETRRPSMSCSVTPRCARHASGSPLPLASRASPPPSAPSAPAGWSSAPSGASSRCRLRPTALKTSCGRRASCAWCSDCWPLCCARRYLSSSIATRHSRSCRSAHATTAGRHSCGWRRCGERFRRRTVRRTRSSPSTCAPSAVGAIRSAATTPSGASPSA